MLKIEGCVSGTLGFLLTEVGRGKCSREALRAAMERGYTEPDPRDDLSGADVGRKALILGRLLGFAGEPERRPRGILVPEVARALPTVPRPPRRPGRRLGEARRRREGQGRDAALRGHGHQGKIAVGLQSVNRTSPFFGLKGTDNQIAFTTTRYRRTRW